MENYWLKGLTRKQETDKRHCSWLLLLSVTWSSMDTGSLNPLQESRRVLLSMADEDNSVLSFVCNQTSLSNQPWTSCWVNFRHQSLTPAETSSSTFHFFFLLRSLLFKNVTNSFSSQGSSCTFTILLLHSSVSYPLIIIYSRGWRRQTQEIRFTERDDKQGNLEDHATGDRFAFLDIILLS